MTTEDWDPEAFHPEYITEEPSSSSSSFDELAVRLANGTLSRSRALKLVGASVLGGALSFLALPVPKAEARRRRKKRRRTPQPTYAFTGSITTSDPTQTGALLRNGVTSTCASPKTPPGLVDTAARHYDVYALTNRSAAACVRVTLITSPLCPAPENLLQSTVYSPSFNPAAIQQNYVADSGHSFSADGCGVYSFNVPANTTFNVVVNEVNPGAGCASYALVVSGLSLP